MKPDFVCLQEVIPTSIHLINESSIMEMYDAAPYSVGRYGCVLLAAKDLEAKFNQVEFHTNMGRSLLTASVKFEGTDLIVATAHFESLNQHPTRELQLEAAAKGTSLHTAILYIYS